MERNQDYNLPYFSSSAETQSTMEERVSSSYNLQHHEKAQLYSSAVSTELSLSAGFQSRSKSDDSDTSSGKHSGKRKSNPKMEKKKGFSSEEIELWGYSTRLNLYEDPWKITKVLTKSDLGKMSRLLLGRALVESLMLPVLGPDAHRDIETEKGTPVRVWDVDTMSMHQLVLKKWTSFLSYVLIGNWGQDFVRRRRLKAGDEIGLHWNPYEHFFNFSVLKRTTTN
ncbi:hypothetical protein L6164_001519 [Bauhinia variegata]|uniref:Uncharacterized protein n=1 Tax=Bauhinia variegata TaxID=167791 RepID=A0ACB9Q991_BAUVA|nr:hypothetical protein L6164_001519 [Bauhinia variegata]